jgi:hypothetical protein
VVKYRDAKPATPAHPILKLRLVLALDVTKEAAAWYRALADSACGEFVEVHYFSSTTVMTFDQTQLAKVHHTAGPTFIWVSLILTADPEHVLQSDL